MAQPDLEAIVRDALALCAIPAPTFAEAARAAAVQGRLRASGLDAAIDATGNVVARVGGPGDAIVVAAHLDTVFPAATPLAPRRDDGVLRGPGIGDNAVALAALLHLGRVLAAEAPPSVPVVLAATVGEEGLGDLRGIRGLLAEGGAACVIAVEGHGIDALVTGGIASARYEARYHGPGGHSWGDRGRVSALHAMFAAGSAAVAAAGPAAANIGVAEGGTSVNSIAAEARLELDLRAADDATLEAAAQRVVRALGAVPKGVTADVRLLGRRPGGALAAPHPLRDAAQAARSAVGLARGVEEAASTDANAPLGAGLPAIAVGLTRGGNAHRPDEWIEVAPLGQGVQALELLVRRLAAGATLA